MTQLCSMQRDVDRLDDILTAAVDVMEFHGGLTRDRFETEKAQRLAILHSLTIIGEAAGRLSEPLTANHPEVPWRRIIAFRNRLVHGYGELDLDLVWEVAGKLVPQLHGQIAAIRLAFTEECAVCSASRTEG